MVIWEAFIDLADTFIPGSSLVWWTAALVTHEENKRGFGIISMQHETVSTMSCDCVWGIVWVMRTWLWYDKFF